MKQKYNKNDIILLAWSITKVFINSGPEHCSSINYAKLTMEEWEWMINRLDQVKANNESDFFQRKDDEDVSRSVSYLLRHIQCPSSWFEYDHPKWHATFHLIDVERLPTDDNESSWDTTVQYTTEPIPIQLGISIGVFSSPTIAKPKKKKKKINNNDVVLLAYAEASFSMGNDINTERMTINFIRATMAEVKRIERILQISRRKGGDYLTGNNEDAMFIRNILTRPELDGPLGSPKWCNTLYMTSIEQMVFQNGISTTQWMYVAATDSFRKIK